MYAQPLLYHERRCADSVLLREGREGNPMFIKIVLLISGLWLLTACTVTPAYVEVPWPVVVVPGVTVEQPQPARHCPPGHAKKGWC